MRALLVANEDDADAGFVGSRLRDTGCDFHVCAREHPGDWPSLDGRDLVVVLGSAWSVYWPAISASVEAESALVRTAQATGVAQLAICYGSQMVAYALGGGVMRSSVPEIGWHEIDSDVPDGISAGPWLQWHFDVVTLPSAATELARNPAGPQAWRLGRTLCTQFHPEVTPAIVARWAGSEEGADELRANGLEPASLVAATDANVVASEINAHRLVDWFLDEVAGAPTGHVDAPQARDGVPARS